MKLPIKIPPKVARVFGKMMLKAKKNRPEICVITGLGLGLTAVVLTGKNTWKHKERLEADVKKIEEVKANEQATEEMPNGEETEMVVVKKALEPQEQKKALMAAKVDFAKDILKAYGVPFVCSVGSVILVWGGRTMLRKDISKLTALLSTVTASYNKLYERVKKEFGEEKAQELAYGVKTVEAVDEETGTLTKRPLTTGEIISPYACWFDEGDFDSESGMFLWRNTAWKTDKLLNITTIQSVQTHLNNLLKMRGYVYLNEARNELGLKPVKNGWKIGWVWHSKLDKGEGDNYIDFGVLPGPHQLSINRLFMDPDNPCNRALIDFNVDGGIEYIEDDILEYDTRSNIALNKRRFMIGREVAAERLKAARMANEAEKVRREFGNIGHE